MPRQHHAHNSIVFQFFLQYSSSNLSCHHLSPPCELLYCLFNPFKKDGAHMYNNAYIHPWLMSPLSTWQVCCPHLSTQLPAGPHSSEHCTLVLSSPVTSVKHHLASACATNPSDFSIIALTRSGVSTWLGRMAWGLALMWTCPLYSSRAGLRRAGSTLAAYWSGVGLNAPIRFSIIHDSTPWPSRLLRMPVLTSPGLMPYTASSG
mmetsp:Transcript_14536/g.31634  ORF Transcript_14536/g.31634 Transcript_14536/m.31634 type:complete len:205 (+) Transcript_14536:660-1274(+)